MIVGVREAKLKLGQLVTRAEAGEEVVITRRGKLVICLRPLLDAPLDAEPETRASDGRST
jgi:prevent-host-death family protein